MSNQELVDRSVIRGPALADLIPWTAEVESWPAGSHVWGHYEEETANGPAICRTENVSACHVGFSELVEGPLKEMACSAIRTEVVSFKDKINYKHPGGAGFSPHQDLLAYPGASEVISVLLAIDECTMSSGCLWAAPGVEELLPTDERGVIREEVVSTLEWEPMEMSPGDAVCIPGLTPHFSKANTSSAERRVLVASYASLKEGYTRDLYYTARQAQMNRSDLSGDQFRISTLADFEGRASQRNVAQAVGSCTHD